MERAQEHTEPVLRISLFGLFEMRHAGWDSPVDMPRASQLLLAYLLFQYHRSCSRDQLAGYFWGDQVEDRARRCLSSALWRLRRVLEPDGIRPGTYLLASTGEVGFNWNSDHWLDVAVFEEQVGQVLSKPPQVLEEADVQKLTQALQLYSADLLNGFYEDWVLRERERLRCLHLNCLAHLMHYSEHHRAFEESLAYGKQILERDPLREEIHRKMMRLYLANGQRASAVQHYELCCNVLATELGIRPMEETQALYNQIVEGRTNRDEYLSITNEPVLGRRHALEQLRLAMQGLEQARAQLRYAIQLVEQLALCQDRRKAGGN
jgi:DNA-binding SARP family transcriptional activator